MFLQQLINLPALNIRGISGGSIREEASNIIPSKTIVDFDCRLVKGMDPDRTLETIRTHIVQQGWEVMNDEPMLMELQNATYLVKLTKKSGFPATSTPLTSPAVKYVVNVVKRVVEEIHITGLLELRKKI